MNNITNLSTKQGRLAFEPVLSADADFGAEFSECRKYRYALWRIWDKSKPLVMFVGLNPSTANENENDPTIKSVVRISKANGYGGVYMVNCYPFISTDPAKLDNSGGAVENCDKIWDVSQKCKDVVFAWGNFSIVQDDGMDRYLSNIFPNAKALYINKNGSPKHPLYCRSDTKFIAWKGGSICR